MLTANPSVPSPRWSSMLSLGLLVALAGAGCGAPAPEDLTSGVLTAPAEQAPWTGVVPAALTPYDAPGPYAVVREWGGPADAFVLYYPRDLGARGELHPILTWGNGTFVVPLLYDGLLRHFASHGIVVIASRSTMTGTGREMLAGVDWLIAQSNTVGSRFYQVLDTMAIGATGHSQGGGGTINVGSDVRVRAIAPIQPAPGNITRVRAPIFLTGGSADWIVPPATLIRPRSYEPATAPIIYGVLTGADHFRPLGNADGFRGYLTAWFKYHLSGDRAAGPLFYGDACGLCTDSDWVVERKNL